MALEKRRQESYRRWARRSWRGFGTAILVLVIFSLTERRDAGLTTKNLTPLLIGFTVAALISLFAPLTQAGWNPARDFGPRIVAFLAGWGDVAIPGPSNGLGVYIVGPMIGGPVGAAINEYLVRPGLDRIEESRSSTNGTVQS